MHVSVRLLIFESLGIVDTQATVWTPEGKAKTLLVAQDEKPSKAGVLLDLRAAGLSEFLSSVVGQAVPVTIQPAERF